MRITIAPALLALALAPPAFAATAEWVFADSFESGCGALVYRQAFNQADVPLWSSPWPAPWQAVGENELADVHYGEARLRPLPRYYSLARMRAPVSALDVDVRFTLRMEHPGYQGVGFYVRQNGGYLNYTAPRGSGYAVFVEGPFRFAPGIGVWKEQNGVEIELDHSIDVPGLETDVRYVVRFQAFQVGAAATTLRARFWPEGESEPSAWQVEFTDTTPALQNVTGGIAVDSWNVIQFPTEIFDSTFVDDIVVTRYCPS